MIYINFKFYPYYEKPTLDNKPIEFFVPIYRSCSRSCGRTAFIQNLIDAQPIDHVFLFVKDYSKTPGGKEDGEIFYRDRLKPAFEKTHSHTRLHINLDGCYGFYSTFLDTIFGNLCLDFGLQKVMHRVEIISNDQPGLVWDIISHMNKVDIEKERKTKDNEC